jgi:hypothetical protein
MLKDLEWTNIPGCKLALDMETLHTLERCNLEIDKISCVESNRPSLGVSIALLSRSGCLQTVTD